MLAKTKAIQLLQTLTAKEVEEFSDHLDLFASKSAAFLKEIVIWCAGFHPQFDQPGFTKEKLLQRLQKRKPVNQDKLRYILSDLALALEKYVVYKNSLRGDARTHLVLLEYYKEKDLERFFNQKFEALEQILDTSASRGTDFHLIKYQACDHRYAYHLRKQREGLDDELQTTSHHLDTYYVIVRLRLFSEMLTREMLLKVTYDKPLLPAILEMASWEPYASDPVVGVYRTVIHMHLEPEREDYFEALQKYIDSSAPLIPKSELNDLLVFSQNYCTGKFNQEKENF
ncbi:MAG: hypothetical protein N2050_00925 [Flavobacteriales bacterium]|nr:hypothetical protein [Flavobacteriales bacterium]